MRASDGLNTLLTGRVMRPEPLSVALINASSTCVAAVPSGTRQLAIIAPWSVRSGRGAGSSVASVDGVQQSKIMFQGQNSLLKFINVLCLFFLFFASC